MEFTEADINYNPMESAISVYVIPHNSGDTRNSAALHFPEMNPNSEISFGNFSPFGGNLAVPSELPLPFDIKVTSEVRIGYFSSQVKHIFLTPGGSSTLNNSELLPVLSPEEGDVTDATVFAYGNGPGLYGLAFRGGGIDIAKFYTSKTSISLGDLKSIGFPFKVHNEYSWTVSKYTEFQSVDDFVSSPYIYRTDSSSVLCSEERRIWLTQ